MKGSPQLCTVSQSAKSNSRSQSEKLQIILIIFLLLESFLRVVLILMFLFCWEADVSMKYERYLANLAIWRCFIRIIYSCKACMHVISSVSIASNNQKIAICLLLPLILPARASLYRPFGSLSSHTSSGTFRNTWRNILNTYQIPTEKLITYQIEEDSIVSLVNMAVWIFQ